ncbi:MAG TPA: PepSY-like domain-containing protein [Bacteroidales bacterium]|nr:PepSY-like domain-containing protein [Bacteroidales bacterium]HRZ48056.1 PepSY-like domain-containing protein [Bacteroidales bacterium]
MNNVKKIAKAVLFVFFLTPVALFAQDRIIPTSEIPSAIQTYIKTHFPGQTIVKSEIDMEGTNKKYEIELNDKTELEFNSKYQIIKIDRKTALPISVIPSKIYEYVKANYPKNSITEWEKEWKHQEVKLDNGIELEFTLNGTFIRIDD